MEQIRNMTINLVFFVMKIMATIFMMGFISWIADLFGIAERVVMFIGGYLFGQYMLKEWSEIIPKKF